MDSARTLTESLVDYAGLFPPANLHMGEAVANYALYRQGESSHMLGRFILSASQLPDFSAAAKAELPKGSDAWKLAVLLSGDFEAEIPKLLNFNCEHWNESGLVHAVVDSVEVRMKTTQDVQRLKAALPGFFSAFVEIDASQPDASLLDSIRDAGFLAKIRTGGVEAKAFPSAAAVARFLDACLERRIAFKATAGLHHLVCDSYPLTYEADSDRAEMFGFLNIFAAAVFLFAGESRETILAIIREREPAAFGFDTDALTWDGKSVPIETIGRARAQFARSFGSCSFTEPIEELGQLLSKQSTVL